MKVQGLVFSILLLSPLGCTWEFDPASKGCLCDEENECCDGCAPVNDGGECLDDEMSCTSDVCVAGACDHVIIENRCLVGEQCFNHNQQNPENQCEYCDVQLVQEGWSNKTAGTPCSDGMYCQATDTCDGEGTCSGHESPCQPGWLCYENDGGECCWPNDAFTCQGNDVFGIDSCGNNLGVIKTCEALSTEKCLAESGDCQCKGGWSGQSCEIADAGACYWTVGMGGGDFDQVGGLAADGKGSVYVAGRFWDTFWIEDKSLTGQGTLQDIFVAKLSDTGAVDWVKSIVSLSYDNVGGIAVDENGEIVLGGNNGAPISLGSAETDLVNIGAFVVKMNSQGNALWGKSYTGGSVTDVALDSEGNVYFAGYYYGTIVFEGTTHNSNAGSQDAFLAKLAGDGTYLWSHSFGLANMDQVRTIAVDADDNLLLCGAFSDATLFNNDTDPDIIDPVGNSIDVVVAKYDQDGNHLFSHGYGGDGVDLCEDIVAAPTGDYVITGYFADSPIDFGGGPILVSNGSDAFIAGFTASGTHAFSKSLSCTSTSEGYGVDVDDLGNVYWTGKFDGTCSLDGDLLVSSSDSDVFLAQLNSTGEALWLTSYGGGSHDSGRAVVFADSNVYHAGYYEDTADFECATLEGMTSAKNQDVFISRRIVSDRGIQ